MPTGSEFRSAATKLRGEAILADIAQQNVQSTNTAPSWYEGPYLVPINQVMDASIINLGLIAAEERRLAEEYDRRAVICDDYTAAMKQWRIYLADWEERKADYDKYYNVATVTVDLPGAKPAEPVRWPMWVEEER